MTLKTRKPTGKASWPIALVAGMQGTGKTWMAAQATASPLVSGAYWISFGETDPDELGRLEGVDFDIVEHDGKLSSIVEALEEIARLPVPAEGPRLVVLDSGSRFWDVLSDRAQFRANKRAKRDDANIGIDLWNQAKSDWQRMLNALRKHRGPSIITARFEEVAIVVNGKPTGDKQWRVKAEKGLAYDVDVVVEMRQLGDFTVSKTRSTVLQLREPLVIPDGSLHELWLRMGLDAGTVGDRTYRELASAEENDGEQPDAGGDRDWAGELEKATTVVELAALGAAAVAAKAPRELVAAIRAKHGAAAEAAKPS